ncbi:MAG: hypothetical protein SFX73_40180 [Kofleriaceae bacterium]|nr:hypothetical protein [Kofleriaceae bacterium]
MRGLPTTTTETLVYFSDESCALPIVLARVPPSSCASTRFARDTDGRPRALGEAYAGTVFTLLAGGACVPAAPGGALFLVAGNPLVDELATVSRVRYDLGDDLAENR